MWVDGAQWQQLNAGDLDSFVRPEEVAAIEVYQSGASMPVEYQTPAIEDRALSRAILQFFLDRVEAGLFLHFEMIPDRLPESLASVAARSRMVGCW